MSDEEAIQTLKDQIVQAAIQWVHTVPGSVRRVSVESSQTRLVGELERLTRLDPLDTLRKVRQDLMSQQNTNEHQGTIDLISRTLEQEGPV